MSTNPLSGCELFDPVAPLCIILLPNCAGVYCRYAREPWLDMLDRTVFASTGTTTPHKLYADSPFLKQWNLTNLVCFKHAVATGATG